MKLIIRILFLFLILFVSIFFVGLFLPKSIRIITVQEINASPSVVFEQLNRFENWSEWSPWYAEDPDMVITLSTPSRGKGSVMSWKSSKIGDCKATMTHSVSPESIAVDFEFPYSGKTTSLWYIEPTDLGCSINWTLNITKLKLVERYIALFYRDEMKELLKLGMDNIKRVSEESEKSRVGEIKIVERPAIQSIVLIDTLSPEQILVKREYMIDYVSRFIEKRELKSTGNPFGIYMGQVNDTAIIYACGIPVTEKTWVWKTLQCMEIPTMKAVSIEHFGGKDASKGFKAINRYIEQNNLKATGKSIEEYIYYTKKTTDTANWEIRVYKPIEK